jgi:hypothetical protein
MQPALLPCVGRERLAGCQEECRGLRAALSAVWAENSPAEKCRNYKGQSRARSGLRRLRVPAQGFHNVESNRCRSQSSTRVTSSLSLNEKHARDGNPLLDQAEQSLSHRAQRSSMLSHSQTIDLCHPNPVATRHTLPAGGRGYLWARNLTVDQGQQTATPSRS